MEKIMAGLRILSRDHGRLPMQWSAAPHAGFTTGKPWMRVHDEYPSLNVEVQARDEGSVLTFYKMLLKLRKRKQALSKGLFTLYDRGGMETMVYTKTLGSAKLLVVLNWTMERQTYDVPADLTTSTVILAANGSAKIGVLEPYEAVVYEISE